MLVATVAIAPVLFVALPAHAVMPSPAMIEQLKRLPKAEQQRLMKQYGIPAQILGDLSNAGQSQALETPQVVNSRVNKQLLQELNRLDINKPEEEEEPLKHYGYDMFKGEPTTFAPVSDIPVPSQYLMGPGDEVKVDIYGKENNTYTLRVSREGRLSIPNIGPMSVVGLTFDDLKQRLSSKINEQYIGVNSNVSLGELRSIRIIIAGEAYKPGSYTVSSLSTITQALFVSGGVNEIASLRNIQLKRAGKTVASFDLYDLLMKGDAVNDKRLQSGDVIFIPPIGKTATIKGEVRRPAIYELKGNESVGDLVQLGAGLKASSFPKASVIERFSSSHLPTLITVDLTQPKGKALAIKDGDVLTVQATTKKIRNQIIVAGSVTRPGAYQWRNGMRVSDLISSQWSDLKGAVDLNYALLTREVNLQGDIETKQFSLAAIFNDSNSDQNFYLQPRDTLVIFSQTDIDEKMADEKVEDEKQKKRINSSESNRENVETLNAEIFEVEGLIEKEPEEEEEDLSALYTDVELIIRSNEFTRRQLLTPIVNKLKAQDLVNGVTNVASISGEVRFPGEYPIAQGARVSHLVTAAGGIKESAYIKQAELTKFIVNEETGATIEHQKIALGFALKNSAEHDIEIGSRDQLTVLKIPSWQENITVTLRGEVKFPGTYSVREGESLDNVIERAGGFTEQAFLEGAVFTRESVKAQELTQIIKFSDQLRLDIAAKGLSGDNGIVFSEASLILKELENLQAVGRMVVSLSNDNKSTHNKLLVEDGDLLLIPPYKQTVTVVGEVQHASTHFFEGQQSFDDYISLAGGVKSRADEERIYIIRANGSVISPETGFWFSNQDTIKPGDTIVVPLDTEYKDNLTLWTQITAIIYNTAVAFSAVKGI